MTLWLPPEAEREYRVTVKTGAYYVPANVDLGGWYIDEFCFQSTRQDAEYLRSRIINFTDADVRIERRYVTEWRHDE